MSCEGCAYAVLLSGMWCCDYLLMTGRRRPGPPGEDCTERKECDLTKKGRAFMRRRDWDTEKAKALYDQKLTDAEIAGEVGTTASAVAFWRRSLGLPANPGQHSPPWEEPKSKAAPSPPVSPPSQPPVLPANGGPAGTRRSPRRQAGTEQSVISSDKGSVELSVELDGKSFALRAPDLEGAARIHAYAGRLLEDMRQIAMNLKEGLGNA